ncbi:MAG: 3-hydroxyacyl-ACP dehydratase FabZ [Acidobacteriota bacterium]|nr:3-hydroxyacyl-ACP dehydratase FabZ [Acidobacteriota bacterium]
MRWITSVLPHRYPFLLVDRVLEIEPGRRIRAYKNVTANEDFFNGHFPGHPVMPGVMIIEGMAQAAGILTLHDRQESDGKLMYFTGIDRARFRRPVVPGDRLDYEIEILRLRDTYCKLRGEARVDGQLAAEATMASALVDR